MNPKANAAYDGHEEVVYVGDEALGYKGIIAIHSTAMGPGAGGCRISPRVPTAIGWPFTFRDGGPGGPTDAVKRWIITVSGPETAPATA